MMMMTLLLTLAMDLGTIRSIDSHLPEDVQIALAKAAGPNVSEAATIYVLGPKGYRVARKGTNGFACLVERQRLDTIELECYDPEGVATVLRARLFVEVQRALGVPQEKIDAEVDAGTNRAASKRRGDRASST